MRIDKLKPFQPKTHIIIPPSGIDGKNVSLIHYSENDHFLNIFRHMGIKPQFVRNVLVPSTQKPISRLTAGMKKSYMEHKLRPTKITFGGYDKFSSLNYYLDLSLYMNIAEDKWGFVKYNSGRPFKFVNSLLNIGTGIPSDTHHKIFLYTVNLNKPISDKWFFRKIFPAWKMMNDEEFPYDQFLLFVYGPDGGKFVKLWDKDLNIPASRIRNYLLRLSNTDGVEDDVVVDSAGKIAPTGKAEEIKTAVNNYLAIDADAKPENMTDEEINDTVVKSVAYHVTGDVDHAKTVAKRMSPADKNKMINRYSKHLLKKEPAIIDTSDPIINLSNIPKLIDNQVPTHILDKRRRDFDENLKEDFTNVFNILGKKEIPLKVEKIEKKLVTAPPSELKNTLRDRYLIKLTEKDGTAHNVHIDLPHLMPNGTFLINGVQRVLINQIITYPIFFFKAYHGQFASVYASMTIISKQIKQGPYLIAHIGGYKMALALLLFYTLGLDNTMKLFNIDYHLYESNEKIPALDPEFGMTLKLPTGRILFIHANSQSGIELMRGMKYFLKSWPSSEEFEKMPTGIERNISFWRSAIVRYIGTRNAIYKIEQVWQNIVTPIEVEVLEASGDPTELDKIIKYIADHVVDGRVDDRNALDRQRIRTSEVFTASVLKQINAAYNEFHAKRAGGDENARLELNPTKAFSEITSSQNVQQLENINPSEEISMMTRITPVGQGGIPDKRAVSKSAMNIHRTYYGNIDPLETPDGPSVGILQHLSVGASIINKRGQFGIRDAKNVKSGEILSAGPALIPFVDSNDGARVTMAAGQMKQAVPLLEPEAPAIQTGYETALVPLLSDNFIKKAPKGQGGVIQSITPGSSIIIKYPEGKGPIDPVSGKSKTLVTMSLRPRVLKSGQGKDGISVFAHNVKEGQKVKAGQIIAEGGGVKNGQIAIGRNLLVAIMPWKGFNFEDGVVISQSAAGKFTSVHNEEVQVVLAEDEDIVYIADVGEVIKKGYPVITYSSSSEDVESYKHERIDGGRIEKIEVYSNVPQDQLPEKLKNYYELFKKEYREFFNKYPEGAFKIKDEKIEGILVKFIIRQELDLVKGDKLNNRHFNKGVVSVIEPDSNMPMTPWGERVELILNPLGVINRMNNGQVLELHVGLVSWKLGSLIREQSRAKFMVTFKKVITLLDGTPDKSYSKDLIQKINSLSDDKYSKMVQGISGKFFPIVVPPFKTPKRSDIIKAMGVLGLEPRMRVDIPGFGKTEEKVSIGYIHQQKLEHMAEKKLASRSVGGYDPKTMAPTQGKKRGGGQKIGEGDLYTLISLDCPLIIEEMFGALSSDHRTKNEIIGEIIQSGEGKFRMAKSNPVKDLYGALMIAIHLESE